MKESFTLSDWLSVLKGGKTIYHFTELLRLSRLSIPALQGAIQRMRKKKILFKLGKGLFANSFVLPRLEEVCGYLYPPCYVSLESALFMHGVMDQAPHVLTCVSTNKTKRFNTDLGEIHYAHVKKRLFFGFVIEDGIPLATPEKAALDFVYIQRQNGFQPPLDEWNWENLDYRKIEEFWPAYPQSVKKHMQQNLRGRRA